MKVKSTITAVPKAGPEASGIRLNAPLFVSDDPEPEPEPDPDPELPVDDGPLVEAGAVGVNVVSVFSRH